MYFNDHNPPHFHAKYAGYEALYNFDGMMFEGEVPKRANQLIRDWIELHKQELADNWERARSGEQLNYIAPLD